MPILVEAGRYRNEKEAEERALVVAAMGCSCHIERGEDDWFSLLVPEKNIEAVSLELDRFELENSGRQATEPSGSIPTVSLYLCGWMLAAFFLIQKTGPGWWENAGIASSDAIVHRGE